MGAVSHGVLFPKYRGDLVQTAVVVERMRAGLIESLHIPANPLDVLAQQIVAMCALDDWRVDDVEAPVSYTHLDVYKRQDFVLALKSVGGSSTMSATEGTFQVRLLSN